MWNTPALSVSKTLSLISSSRMTALVAKVPARKSEISLPSRSTLSNWPRFSKTVASISCSKLYAISMLLNFLLEKNTELSMVYIKLEEMFKNVNSVLALNRSVGMFSILFSESSKITKLVIGSNTLLSKTLNSLLSNASL